MGVPIAELIAKISADRSGLTSGLAAANAQLNEFADKATETLEKGAKAGMAGFGRALSGIGDQMRGLGMGMTAAITLPFAGLVKAGADVESSMMKVANNTTLTTGQISLMNDTVKRLGMESGASFDQLGQGFMHIVNFGFSASDSVGILDAAMKSAVASGGDVGQTANVLANVMHEFSIPVRNAAGAMNMLHVEANRGNMTLEQLVEAGGPAFAMAANLGVSVTETAAALATFTQHGFSASEGATQFRGIISHIIGPAKQVSDRLDDISQKTGVNLVRDFSTAGLRAKGFVGVLNDIRAAAAKLGESALDLIIKLIPALRGGVGAMALVGTGLQDLQKNVAAAKELMTGAGVTQEQYTRQQKTLQAEVDKAKNSLVMLGKEIEDTLLPALSPLIEDVRSAVSWFMALPGPVKTTAIAIAAFAAILGPVLLGLGGLAGGIGSIITLCTTLAPVIGGVAAAITGPLGLAIVAGTAAVAGLAWALHALGGDAQSASDDIVGRRRPTTRPPCRRNSMRPTCIRLRPGMTP